MEGKTSSRFTFVTCSLCGHWAPKEKVAFHRIQCDHVLCKQFKWKISRWSKCPVCAKLKANKQKREEDPTYYPQIEIMVPRCGVVRQKRQAFQIACKKYKIRLFQRLAKASGLKLQDAVQIAWNGAWKTKFLATFISCHVTTY